MTTWPEVLGALVARHRPRPPTQTAWAMGEILAGEATPAQIAGFAVALRAKGETIDEVAGLVDAMYAAATPIAVPGRLLDVVGTGGDRSMSVNISTMAAIVAAGAGARVVKHGNRSASSKSGSADVLEALGIRLDLPRRPGGRGRRARPASRSASPPPSTPRCGTPPCPRRELGIGTTFNFLGPLANPARPAAQAIGCADARMAPVMAGVFAAPRRRRLGVPRRRRPRRADHHHHLVGVGGRTTARSPTATVDPADARPRAGAPPRTLRGGDAAHNADVVTPAAGRRDRAGARRRAAQRGRRAGGLRRAGRAGRRGAGGGHRPGAGGGRLRGREGDPGPLGAASSASRPVEPAVQLGGEAASSSRSSLCSTSVQPCTSRRL